MSDDARIAALARVAREAEPPALERGDERSMILVAIASAERSEAEAVAPARRYWPWAAGAALVAAACALWALAPREPVRQVTSAPHAPSELTLPSGDRIGSTPGARFDLERAGAQRRVRLDEGTLAFEVAPLGEGSSFVVVTPHLTARVVGTVFTVQASPERSIVRVYEGRVEVEDARGRRVLRAGELAMAGAEPEETDPLLDLARRMANRRARRIPTIAPAPAPTETLRPAPAPEPRVRFRDVRAWIAAGETERALAVAREQARRGVDVASWRMLEGDALRAAGRADEAIGAYARAAEAAPDARVRAGYLIATTRARSLHDAEGALRALDEYQCTGASSPLAERALALRVELLRSLGRHDEAAADARAYLERFAEGPRRAAMEALTR